MTGSTLQRQIARWRWFPIGILAALALVILVNAGMIYAALHTNPGKAGADGFGLSNRYDAVIARADEQSRFGWRIHARVDADRHPSLQLTGPDGAPLARMTVTAHAERPVGPPQTTALTFAPSDNESLVARETLAPGQWVVAVTLSRDARTLTATERLVVP